MKKQLLLLFTVLVLCSSLLASNTSVSATVTGSDGQLWTNGTYIITFRPTPGVPGPYTVGGATFNQGPFTGTLNSSGALSITLTDNLTIQPGGSQWAISICPNATAQCNNVNITVTGTTQDLSTELSGGVISVKAPPMPKAYDDNEIVGVLPGVASFYYRTSTDSIRTWDGTQWKDVAAGSSVVSNFVPFDCSYLSTIPNGFLQEIDSSGNPYCNFSSLVAQSNSVIVGDPEPSFNFVDTASVVWSITDDPLNGRTNVAATATGSGGNSAGNNGDVQLSDGAGGFLAVAGGNFNYNTAGNGLLSVGAGVDIEATAGVPLNIIGNGDTTTGNSLTGINIQLSGSATQTSGIIGMQLGLAASGAGSLKGIVINSNSENIDATGILISSLTGTGTKIGLNIGNMAIDQYAILTDGGKIGIGGTFELSNCTSAGGTCIGTISGAVTIAAGATTITVATTTITAKSRIFITEDSSLGSDLGITCNNTLGRTYAVTTRTAATSFVIASSAAPSVNPACLSFFIVN